MSLDLLSLDMMRERAQHVTGDSEVNEIHWRIKTRSGDSSQGGNMPKSSGLSRREFLGTTASAMAIAGGMDLQAAIPANADEAAPAIHPAPASILVLYLARPDPSWPRPDFQPHDDIQRIRPWLEAFEAKRDPAAKFTGHEVLRVPGDLSRVQGAIQEADGILAFNLTSGVRNLVDPLNESGRPLVLFSQPYSGHDWSVWPSLLAKGGRVEVVASSDFGDLEMPLRVLAAQHQLRQSRVVCIRPDTQPTAASSALEKKFGASIRFVPYSRLQALYDAGDRQAAQRDAGVFTNAALKVVEPKPAEVADAFRLYHAIEKLMEEEQANAITIDCLGGFRRGDLTAYPCVAWSKLNDRLLYGVCEADLASTFTQILFTSYSGKPGFVSDPVIDTKTNTVIHAHCVCATRLDGVNRPAAPYLVRSHMEDNKGVSMQVKWPLGQTVTVAKLADAETLLVSTGKVTASPDVPRGCRTKVTTGVRDASKMLMNYSGGLHRVLFRGDHLRAAHQMGHLLGLKVVEET